VRGKDENASLLFVPYCVLRLQCAPSGFEYDVFSRGRWSIVHPFVYFVFSTVRPTYLRTIIQPYDAPKREPNREGTLEDANRWTRGPASCLDSVPPINRATSPPKELPAVSVSSAIVRPDAQTSCPVFAYPSPPRIAVNHFSMNRQLHCKISRQFIELVALEVIALESLPSSRS
jgi:hypothetical protein